jgi:hypothetical protein
MPRYRSAAKSRTYVAQSGSYRFGSHVGYGRRRSALSQINGYLKEFIEAIANAKLRRMEEELALRGIRCELPRERRITNPGQHGNDGRQ